MDKSYPLDAIGNPIRKSDLIRVALAEAALIFNVVDVTSAGTLIGPDDQPLALNGQIVIQAVIPVPFQSGQPMSNVLVLRKPEPDGGAPTLVPVTEMPAKPQ